MASVRHADAYRVTRAASPVGIFPLTLYPGREAYAMARSADWFDWVNEGETAEQLSGPRRSMTEGQPLKAQRWWHSEAWEQSCKGVDVRSRR
jgi:hypothetical protein